MAILILGSPDDPHATHVGDALRTQGRDVAFLNSTLFPAQQKISFDPTQDSGHFVLPEGQRYSFSEISSVYWRTYDGIGPVDLPDRQQADLASNDARGLFESLLLILPARWVNSFRAVALHQTKPVQLNLVSQLDLAGLIEVPGTVHTNDPETVRQFAAQYESLIFKPVQGGAHTRRLAAENMTSAMFDALRYAPVTLQEEIRGVDTRVFVAGQEVFACEVHTDKIDFRDDPHPVIEAITLPTGVEEACRKIATLLQLVWTGIDLRRTPEGNYYFFEANPSPMFLGFEQRAGLPLTAALVALLN